MREIQTGGRRLPRWLPRRNGASGAVVNERGERLLAVRPPTVPPKAAPAFALALATVRDRVLLVRNARRGHWELPGGWIDPGESPSSCALRELWEESGWRGHMPRLLAWIELRQRGCRTPLVGAVFGVRLAEQASFQATEVTACRCWPLRALPADTSAIDAWLGNRLSRP